MADLSNTIAESEYVFDEKAMQLMQNFFEINDTSLLKAGNLGYQTSLLTHAMRDGTFHRDALFNEQFLISASQNSTLYNWAKTLDYDISLATPSHFDIGFRISLAELARVSNVNTEDNSIATFTIDRTTQFDIGGYKFILPYSAVIRSSRSSTGQVSVTASYNYDEYNFKSSLVVTPYLKVLITNSNGVDYVVVNMRVFQLTRKEWIYTMTSTDLLDSSIIDVAFGGNLSSFKAFYNPNSSSTSVYRGLELIFNEVNEPTTDSYTYYTFLGDDTLRVYFSNKSGAFHPAFNSKIKIETFTTEAEAGNFNYSGNVNITSSSFDGITYNIISVSTATTGGSSIKSFKDTKIALMEKLRTRNNYTTTYDLSTYFSTIKKSELKTNSNFEVVKLRDDILRRQFSCYVLQRNSSGDLVPTNTIDLELDISELESLGYSIKPGTLILYDRINSKYRLLEDSELPEVYLQAPDSYLFCVPYLINIDFKEFPKSNIYLTNYEKTNSLSYYSYNVKNPYEIVMNNYNLTRNPMFNTDYFKLNCFINTSTVNLDNILVRAVLMQNNTPTGYFDLNRVGSSTEFSLNVLTDDKFNDSGYYIIRDTIRSIDNNNIIAEFPLNGDYYLRIGVFIKGASISTEKSAYTFYKLMDDLSDYGIICEFESDTSIAFADDLSDIMYCQTIMNSSNGKISINKIPVINALFYLNQYQNTEIMNDIYSYIKMVRNVSSNLENNTSIDVKFYNTSGLSKYFDIDTTDIKLRFDIALATTETSTLDSNIRTTIVNFIENINSLTEKRFSISNLIKTLENTYTAIKYIKFTSINGSNIQNIEQIQYAGAKSEDLPYTYVPEYLCVRKNVPNDSSISDFTYDIEINYV